MEKYKGLVRLDKACPSGTFLFVCFVSFYCCCYVCFVLFCFPRCVFGCRSTVLPCAVAPLCLTPLSVMHSCRAARTCTPAGCYKCWGWWWWLWGSITTLHTALNTLKKTQRKCKALSLHGWTWGSANFVERGEHRDTGSGCSLGTQNCLLETPPSLCWQCMEPVWVKYLKTDGINTPPASPSTFNAPKPKCSLGINLNWNKVLLFDPIKQTWQIFDKTSNRSGLFAEREC